jgi:hypothetical protein
MLIGIKKYLKVKKKYINSNQHDCVPLLSLIDNES